MTLACEDGEQVLAHKVILAASSPFFKNLLRKNNHTHPLFYMRGMKSVDLVAMVEFLYKGETRIFQENFDSFLAIAEELQLKGLVGQRIDSDMVQKEPTAEMPVMKKPNEVNVNDKKLVIQPNILEEKNESLIGEQLTENNLDDVLTLDLQKLHDKTNSLMEKTSTKNANGRTLFRCKVCGKKLQYATNMRNHIESVHLEGVFIPCKTCGKVFRARNSLLMYNLREHKGRKNHF